MVPKHIAKDFILGENISPNAKRGIFCIPILIKATFKNKAKNGTYCKKVMFIFKYVFSKKYPLNKNKVPVVPNTDIIINSFLPTISTKNIAKNAVTNWIPKYIMVLVLGSIMLLASSKNDLQ